LSNVRNIQNIIRPPSQFPDEILKYINDDECKFTVAFKKILGKLASIDNIYNFIEKTFPKYQYAGASYGVKETTGIKVGLFELTPKPFDFPNFPNYKPEAENIYNEIAIKNNNQIFKLESDLKDKFKKQDIKYTDYFYFNVDSGPTYWESENFQNMDTRVYIFICTTQLYLPICHTNPSETTRFGHSWLTTVLLQKDGTYITNIFDTNSTHIFNFQYARKLETLTGVYILPQNEYALKRYETYIGYESPNSNLYFLDCQNKQSSNPGQDCIGLQNNDKWGFCQTFMLIMYLVILHNPILAGEPLEVVIKRPGLVNIMNTNVGFLDFANKMLKEVNSDLPLTGSGFIPYIPSSPVYGGSKKNDFGRITRRSSKSLRSALRRRRSVKKQIKNKSKKVKKSNGRKKRTCAS
jgi:hypothetical protein